MKVTQTAANVIDDNNTSQPIAASESRLTCSQPTGVGQKLTFVGETPVRFNWQLEITGVQ